MESLRGYALLVVVGKGSKCSMEPLPLTIDNSGKLVVSLNKSTSQLNYVFSKNHRTVVFDKLVVFRYFGKVILYETKI